MAMQKSEDLLAALLKATTTQQIEAILTALPIVPANDYTWDASHTGWRDGHLHWVPVGLERGNGGRIKLANEPYPPIAERLVNGMEAIIELQRLLELQQDPNAPMPKSPRDAVARYFGLCHLDEIESLDTEEAAAMHKLVNKNRQKLTVHLAHDKKSSEFTVTIRDKGMGQSPQKMHSTLLSLGDSDKPDKPYLIGLFGQGGSSTFAASEYSVVATRRAPDVLQPSDSDGVGWSIVRQIFPKSRRDPYFAYLAAAPTGAVPFFEKTAADAVGFTPGSHFSHIKYDFAGSAQAVSRQMYSALNHVLFNPVLPYDLYAMKEKPDLMQGTAQRLAKRVRSIGQKALDKSFSAQAVL